MKYLVNRETKEHKIYRFPDYVPPLWDLVDADPEGWIKHGGGECPLPDDQPCAIRSKGRSIFDTHFDVIGALARHWEWDWKRSGRKITRYRPVFDAEIKDMEDNCDKNIDDKTRLDFGYGDSFVDDKPEANPVPCATPEESLIGRLRASHKAASQLPDIIAELREVLEPMGYDLVARDPFVEPSGYTAGMALYADGWKSETEPDMTDWRNWREGDVLECIVDRFDLTKGGIYKVKGLRGRSVEIDDDRDKDALRDTDAFRFHSRPTKEQYK